MTLASKNVGEKSQKNTRLSFFSPLIIMTIIISNDMYLQWYTIYSVPHVLKNSVMIYEVKYTLY